MQDERLTGACYVHFVRSTVAHATIAGIVATAALEAPGVLAVYTASDLAEAGLSQLPPMMPNMNQAMKQPLLASDVVRFVGEPVAAVVTEEMYQGEDAIELVDIDYDILPAVATMHQSLSGERGLVFPAAGTNVVCTFGDPSASNPDLFAGCEVVVSAVIQNRRVAPAPMESRSGAAAWGEDGRLNAWIPNQGAQLTKGVLLGMLGLKPDEVRIITPDVGGAFGAKFGPDPEHGILCWIAKQLGRPVRWSETRMENLVGMPHGRAQEQKITIGGMQDGTVLRLRRAPRRAGPAARGRGDPSARHRPVLLRGDHRARRRGGRPEREQHRRGPLGRHRHHLDRHLTARPGSPDRVGDARDGGGAQVGGFGRRGRRPGGGGHLSRIRLPRGLGLPRASRPGTHQARA